MDKMDNVISAELIEDNKIKLNKKRTGSFRKIFKKVKDGITNVANIPGTIFSIVKQIKKEMTKEEAIEYVTNQPGQYETYNLDKRYRDDQWDTGDRTVYIPPLGLIDKKWCKDKDVVLAAVLNDYRSFDYASNELKKDPDIINAYEQKNTKTTSDLTQTPSPDVVMPAKVESIPKAEDNPEPTEKPAEETSTIDKVPEPSKQPLRTIFGRTLFAKKDEKENNDVENVTTEPENVNQETSEPKIENIATPIDLNIKNDDKEEKQEETPKEKSDTEILEDSREKYGDLIPFNTWEDYYNSFSTQEKENKTKNGELLTEKDFIRIKLNQALTIKRITEDQRANYQAEQDKLNQEVADRKAQLNENRDEIKSLRGRITHLNDDNKRLKDENAEANKRLITLNSNIETATDKIDEMEDTINKLEGKERTKDDEAKRRVREIFKEEEKKFNEQQKKTSKKETMGKVASAIDKVAKQKRNQAPKTQTPLKKAQKEVSKVEESPLFGELDEFNDSAKTSEATSKVAPRILELTDHDFSGAFTAPELAQSLESTNPDFPGTFTVNNDGTLTANWKNSPMTTENAEQNTDDFYMGFNPQTRSEIGQEAMNRLKNSDGSISFDDFRNQVAQEYEQSKGRTR